MPASKTTVSVPTSTIRSRRSVEMSTPVVSATRLNEWPVPSGLSSSARATISCASATVRGASTRSVEYVTLPAQFFIDRRIADASAVQRAEHGDAADDRDHTDDLHARQALAEQEERRHRGDSCELRREHGGDGEPVPRAERIRREAEHLAQAADDGVGQRVARHAPPTSHEER